MNDDKLAKLESPVRIEELDPKNTLLKIGFKEGMVLCDIGAGTGIFSFPATEISTNDIYALDISDRMIELLEGRKIERSVSNLKIKKVESDTLPLDDSTCDMVIMITVFHEIGNKESMLKEIRRILKETGKLMLVEFHKRETPYGPPVDHRISAEYTEEICNDNNFITHNKFTLSDNFYCIVFEL